MLDATASIIISNYNYAAFVGSAIDSALAVEWPELEVIVVDDGSTDDSRQIIKSYGDRIVFISQKNSGQRVAYETGLAASRGKMIIFLDSDDMLAPGILKEAAAVWNSGVSKVQVQTQIIDKNGKTVGSILPPFYVVPTPDEVRRWMLSASAYPTPPGSANIFARDFLEKIFPADDDFDYAGDSYTLAAAPILGDVVTIAKPLAFYRVHGRNDGAMLQIDAGRLAGEFRRAQRRFAYACNLARVAGMDPNPNAVYLSLASLPYRVASFRLQPDMHPVAGDGRLKILRDAAMAAVTPQGVILSSRLVILAWTLIVLSVPRQIAAKLILWRFVPAARPQHLRNFLRTLKAIR